MKFFEKYFKKLIIFIPVFLLIMSLPGKVQAYTGTETLTVLFSNTWADNSSFYFTETDNQKYSQKVFDTHLSAMMSTINNDMTTHGASYYIISSFGYAGTTGSKYVRYYVKYLTTLTGTNGLLTDTYDTYAYSSGTDGQIQLRKYIADIGTREFRFRYSTSADMSIQPYTTETSTYHTAIYDVSMKMGYSTLYLPATYFPATNIDIENLKQINFKVNTYTGYPFLKFNNDTLTRGTTYNLTNYLDPYVSLNITGKYAVLFTWKDNRQIKTSTTSKGTETYCCPQGICGGGTSCDLNYFKYKGEYKYGYWNIDTNQLGRERYTSQTGTGTISYDEWQYFSLGIGSGGLYGDWRDRDQLYGGTFLWGYIFYNANMSKDAFIQYNSNLFNYKILDTENNNVEQTITYTDINGTNQTKTITDAIYTDVVSHYVSDNIFETINDFVNNENAKILDFKGLMDQLVDSNANLANFLSFVYAFSWFIVLIWAIRK